MGAPSRKDAGPRRFGPDLESGRVNQKLRTREALVNAAIELLQKGGEFSVGDVADAARVGRTTAYRYFPTLDALITQAVLGRVGKLEDRKLDEIFAARTDPQTRLDAVVTTSDQTINAYEAEYRTLLRLSLEPRREGGDELPRRPAYRQRWLSQALTSLRKELGPGPFQRLIAALSLCVGVEATVVLRDICLLAPGTASEVKHWAARALLRAALAEARKPARMNGQRIGRKGRKV
jgi:AcrR family transcriptional regulator